MNVVKTCIVYRMRVKDTFKAAPTSCIALQNHHYTAHTEGLLPESAYKSGTAYYIYQGKDSK